MTADNQTYVKQTYVKLLELLIEQAVHTNNDFDGWDVRQSFDEQREAIEQHDTQTILDAILPDVARMIQVAFEDGRRAEREGLSDGDYS